MTEGMTEYEVFAPTSIDAMAHDEGQAVMLMTDRSGRHICLTLPLVELQRAVSLIAAKRSDESVKTPLRVVNS